MANYMDAIMGQAIEAQGPNMVMVKQFMQGQSDVQQAALRAGAREELDALRASIKAATDEGAPQSVLDGYNDLIAAAVTDIRKR